MTRNAKKRKAKKRERANLPEVNGELESKERGISGGSDGFGPPAERRTSTVKSSVPLWEPKHKIFLSHSGIQKSFTEHLCDKLEAVQHYPFFDQRDDCLRNGEKFYPPLMKAAKECRVAVLVLSHDFFTNSKWPMMELNEFVKAQDNDNKRLKILPLLLGITFEEIKEKINRFSVVREEGKKEKRDRKGGKDKKDWETAWKTFKENDDSIDLAQWKHAVSKLPGNNPIQYAGAVEGELAFIKRVVEVVCKLEKPDVKWDVSHVQSVKELCEPIFNKLKIEPYDGCNVRVVGLHGMGGVGKTTISRAICNEMFGDFGGKVCHVELGSMSDVEVVKTVLRELTDASSTIVADKEHGQLVGLLVRMKRQKVFLVLDNVWDNPNQIEEVQRYLKAGYHDGSMVLVTSRSLDILVNLLHIPECDCLEMESLEEEGATDLFLQYIGCSKETMSSVEREIVKRCVNECFFLKDVLKQTFHYHPLALKALGSQLRCISCKACEWDESLKKLKVNKFNMLKHKVHPVHSILRLGYDALDKEEQDIFMDLALVWVSKWKAHSSTGLRFEWEWLCIIHGNTEADLLQSVKALLRKGLLDNANEVEKLEFSIHDLYVEFAEVEARAGPPEGRRFFIDREPLFGVPRELLKSPPNGSSLERLVIHNSQVQSLKSQNLHLCKNISVFDLHRCAQLQEIDVTDMKNLRCMVVTECNKLGKCKGLQELSNLAILHWACNEKFLDESKSVHELSALIALEVLKLKGLAWPQGEIFPPDLRGCTNLRELTFSHIFPDFDFRREARSAPTDVGKYLPNSVMKIDFSYCCVLSKDSAVRMLSSLTNLQDLNLEECDEITDLTWVCELISLQRLNVGGTSIFGLPNNLGKLLKQLQFLNVSFCWNLRSIVGIAHATALQRVDASFCYKLRELPHDFSSLKKLEMLSLVGDKSIYTLPKDYAWLAGHPKSKGTTGLKVKVWGCFRLIAPLVKKLLGRGMSRQKHDDACSCEGESMQSWIDAKTQVDSAAYSWLKNIINIEGFLGFRKFFFDAGEGFDVVIRAFCEHDDRWIADRESYPHVDEWSPMLEEGSWWVRVTTAPCTFGVVTQGATLEPWHETLVHYTIVRLLPWFLDRRQRIVGMEAKNSPSFYELQVYNGIVAVLLKCKQLLERARDQGIDPKRSNEGMKVVDTFLTQIEVVKYSVIMKDSILWPCSGFPVCYRDLFPNFPFEGILASQDTSKGGDPWEDKEFWGVGESLEDEVD